MKTQCVRNCAFSSWYPTFKSLSIESLILKLPKPFLDYLKADGLYLPDDVSAGYASNSRSYTGDSGDEDWSEQDPEEEYMDSVQNMMIDSHQFCNQLFASLEFKNFQQHIDAAIHELGGKVFPKLNWSSPKDAAWITPNNKLCCENRTDIYLLLKSSDFVMHDLTQPFVLCDNALGQMEQLEYVLVLRKWLDINPSGEFRCFVRSGKLLAVSQRHSQFFPHIEQEKEETIKCIVNFFNCSVKTKFPDTDYTFDIYQTCPGTIILIDFNPFCEITDGLMFSWQELTGMVPMTETQTGDTVLNGVVFRYLRSDGIGCGDNLRQYSYPLDFQHLRSGEDPAKLIDLLNMHREKESDNESQ